MKTNLKRLLFFIPSFVKRKLNFSLQTQTKNFTYNLKTQYMKKIVLLLTVILFSMAVNAQTIGDYRSQATGLWSNTASWARWNGTIWASPAPSAPVSTDGVITILTGHTITMSTSATVDQVVVNTGGQLTIGGAAAVTLTLNNGAGNDLDVSGIVKDSLNAAVWVTTGCVANIANGGKYIMQKTSTYTIPTCTWVTGSTCEIAPNGTGGTLGGVNQSFSHFRVLYAGTTGTMNCVGLLTTINGNLIIDGTGAVANGFTLTNATTCVLNIGGKLTVNAGILKTHSANGNLTVNVTDSINVNGGRIWGATTGRLLFTAGKNVNLNGGTFDYSITSANSCRLDVTGDLNINSGAIGNTGLNGNSGGSDTTNITGNFNLLGGSFIMRSSGTSPKSYLLNIGGNFNMTSGTFTGGSTSSYGNVNFTGGTANVTFTKSGGTITASSPTTWTIASGKTVLLNNDWVSSHAQDTFYVNSGGTLDCKTNNITGTAPFVLGATATLKSGSSLGITTSGSNGSIQSSHALRTFPTTANYEYNGTVTQVTGNGLPATVNNLTINNTGGTSGVTLTSAVAPTGTLTFTNGNLTLAANDITLLSATAVAGSPSTLKHIVAASTGRVKCTYSSGSYIFPLGYDDSHYNPVTLTNSGGSSSIYSVGTTVATTFSPALASLPWSWDIKSSTSSATTVAMSFTTADAGATLAAAPSTGFAHSYDGSSWTPLGGGTVAGTPNVTTQATVTTLNNATSIWSVAALTPSLNVSLSSLSFGSINTLTNSASQTYNISGTNLTGAPGTITVTAPNTDFQVSNDNATWGSSCTIAYATATLSATPVYVRFTPQTNGAKTGNVTVAGGGTSGNPTVAVTGTGVTNYYNAPNTNMTNTNNWGTGTDGISGTTPPNFTNNYQVFNVTNPTGSGNMSAALTITGTGSKMIVGDGTAANTCEANQDIVAIVDVLNNATLKYTVATPTTTFGTIATGSTVEYAAASGAQTVLPVNYHHFVLSGGGTRSFSATTGIAGTFTPGTGFSATSGFINLNGAGVQTIPGFSYWDLAISGSGTQATSGYVIVKDSLAMNNSFTVNVNDSVFVDSMKIMSSVSGKTMTVNGMFHKRFNYTIASPTFNVGSGTMTVAAGGTFKQSGYPSGNASIVLGGVSFAAGASGGTLLIAAEGGAPRLISVAGNVVWNTPLLTSTTGVIITATPVTIGGNLTFISTGTGSMNGGTGAASPRVLNVTGNLNMQGGTYELTNGPNGALQTLSITGNVNITGGNLMLSNSVAGSGVLNVAGNLTHTSGNFGAVTGLTNGTLNLNGTVAQNISTTGISNRINLTLNNTNGAVLKTNIDIMGTTTLTSGKLRTNGFTYHVLGTTNGFSGVAAFGTTSASYIAICDSIGTTPATTGGLKIDSIGTGGRATAVIFPVGPSLTSYNPITVLNSSSHTNYTVRVNTTAIGVIPSAQSLQRTWNVTPEVGTPNTKLAMQWVVGDEGATFTTNKSTATKIVHYDGATIDLLSQTGAAVGAGPFTYTSTVDMAATGSFGVTVGNPPVITVTGSYSAFGLQANGSSSAGQGGVQVSGTNLQSNLDVTAPTGYEVSTTFGSGYGASVSLVPTSGTVAATTIYTRFSPSSCGTISGNVIAASTNATTQTTAVTGIGIAAEPTTNATSIAFANVTYNSMDINFTAGNGAKRIIVLKPATAVDYMPNDNVASSGVNADYSIATDQGTGNKIVYEGTSNTVSVTGLNQSTTYHVAVYEFNECTGAYQNYFTTGFLTGSQATAVGPDIVVTGSLTNYGLNVVNTNSSEQNYTVAGSNLLGDITVTAPTGFEISTTSGSGFGSSVILTHTAGTVATTTIYARFSPTTIGNFSGNISHTSPSAVTRNQAVSATSIATEPTTASTGISFATITPTSIQVNWSANGNGAKRIVVARAVSTPVAPNDNASYSANADVTLAATTAAGSFVVYDGTGSTVTVTGLNPATVYQFSVYEYNDDGSGAFKNYLTSSNLNGSQTTLATEPTTQATAITFSSILSTTMTIGFTNGNGANRLVLVKAGSAVDATPTDATSYTANAAFATGDQIGAGNYVVYQGTANSIALTGLTANTVYYVQVFENNGTGASLNYNVNTATGNPNNRSTLAAEPTVQATAINFTGVTTTAMTVNWTRGNGDSVIVVMKATTAVNSDPVDGNATGYTANAAFVSGTQLGTGNYVMYKGTGTSVNITGLNPATNYNVAVYEFSGTTNTYNYLAPTAAIANQTTNQSIYYWVGGATGTNGFADQSNWSSSVGGAAIGASGTLLTIGTTDKFVYDGSNIVTGGPTTGNVTTTVNAAVNLGQIELVNSAKVTFAITAGVNITVNGAIGTDLLLSAGSKLSLTSTTANLSLVMATNTTATINDSLLVGVNTIYNTGAVSAITTVSNTGVIKNTGAVTNTLTSNLLMNAGSFYIHNLNAAFPTKATWAATSTLEITGFTSYGGASSAFDSTITYGNVTWNNSGQTATCNIQGGIKNVVGNLYIKNTGASGTARFYGTSGNISLNIGGDFIQDAGIFNFGNGTATAGKLNIGGNINQTGGLFRMNVGSSNKDTINLTGVNKTINFSGTQTTEATNQFIIKPGASYTLNSNFPIQGLAGALLDSGTLTCGIFQIAPVASSATVSIIGTLKSANVFGLSGSASTTLVSTNNPTITLGSSSTIEYNGAGGQTISVRPDYANLLISGDRGGIAITLPQGTIGVTGNVTSTATNTSYTTTLDTVDMKGAAQNIQAFTFGSLKVSGNAIKTMTGNVTINENFLYAGSSTLALNSNALNLNGRADLGTTNPITGSGAVNVNNGGRLITANTTGIVGSLPSATTNLFSGSTVEFNAASGSQAIDTRVDYSNVRFSNAATKNLGGDISIADSLIFSSSKLTLNANTLTLGGGINGMSASSSFVSSNASNIVATTASGTIFFDQTTSADTTLVNGTNAISNFSKTGAGTIILGNKMNLFSKLTSTGGTFNSNGFAVLRSTASNTAWVPNQTGAITGMVTVERYMHTGIRGWKGLTAPITYNGVISGNNNTINQNWQSNFGYAGKYGTRITFPTNPPVGGSGIDDYSPSANMQSWNPVTQAWVKVNNTFTSLQANSTATAANIPYFLFVRGDRSVTPNQYATWVQTTIAAKGLLQTGTQTYTVPSGSQFGSTKSWAIGNPYACPVDMSLVTFTDNTTLTDFVYVWEPAVPNGIPNTTTTGKYITYDRTNWNAAPVGGGSGTKYFQSGSIYFVAPLSSGATITYNENSKVTTNQNNIFVTGVANSQTDYFNINLVNVATGGVKSTIDGARAKFGATYSANVDVEDAPKWTTGGGVENFSLLRNGSTLSIEARPYIDIVDTLFLNISAMGIGNNYEFMVNTVNFDATVSSCVIIDKFLNTQTPVSLSSITNVPFTVTSATGSNVANRFIVVFTGTGALPNNSIAIAATKKAKTVEINWETISENGMKNYTVEKSTTGNNFQKLTTSEAKNGNKSNLYSVIDANPSDGVNYYRVQGISASNNSLYSVIVKVDMSSNSPKGFAIYPNPVKGNNINLQTNSLNKGSYTAKLFTANGQQVFTKTINILGGNASVSLQINNAVAAGNYQLQLTDSKGNSFTQTVVMAE
jgi:hypothetical protein